MKKFIYGLKWLLFWIQALFILAVSHPSVMRKEWREVKDRFADFKLKNRW